MCMLRLVEITGHKSCIITLFGPHVLETPTCQGFLMNSDKCINIFRQTGGRGSSMGFLFIALLAGGFWNEIHIFIFQLGNHNICLSPLAFGHWSPVFCRRHPRSLLRPNDDGKQEFSSDFSHGTSHSQSVVWLHHLNSSKRGLILCFSLI